MIFVFGDKSSSRKIVLKQASLDKNKLKELGLEELPISNISNIINEVDDPVSEEKYETNISVEEEKCEPKYSKKDIVLCLNYNKKSHVLFGDFFETHKHFGDNYLKKQDFAKFSPNLKFGSGWVITRKNKNEVLSALNENKIQFTQLSKKEFIEKFENEH